MRMENKRGQITIFIIIGLVLAISVGLFFMFQRSKEVSLGIRIDPAPIKFYVKGCLDEVAPPGIYLLASRGGYIYYYDNILPTEYEQVSYHLEYNKDVAPKREFMEEELARFIGYALRSCIGTFEEFDYYDFGYGEMDVEATISNDDVFIKVNYPITIIQQDSKVTISDFTTDIPIRLGHILDVKNSIISKISENIDLDELSSYDVEVNLLPYDKNNIVYSIYDPESNINEVPFTFSFAVKSEFVENKAPIVEAIEEKIAYIDETFNLKITASDPEGDAITFRNEIALFSIDSQTGEINFAPTPADAGLYEIPIIVSDGFKETNRVLRLNITER